MTILNLLYRLLILIRNSSIKTYFNLYYRTPKGKKEVMYQSALSTMNQKVDMKSKLQEEIDRQKEIAYNECISKGHHHYLFTVADMDNKQLMSENGWWECEHCGHINPADHEIKEKYHREMAASNVPVHPATREVLNA